ncbi:MAG TPA: flagellar hook-length control protein FliK [Firmicutes bacterium]|nr:flagellar hook-length control protein FliK [Candidatus Fermentithermobacillaceae bacterium]
MYLALEGALGILSRAEGTQSSQGAQVGKDRTSDLFASLIASMLGSSGTAHGFVPQVAPASEAGDNGLNSLEAGLLQGGPSYTGRTEQPETHILSAAGSVEGESLLEKALPFASFRLLGAPAIRPELAVPKDELPPGVHAEAETSGAQVNFGMTSGALGFAASEGNVDAMHGVGVGRNLGPVAVLDEAPEEGGGHVSVDVRLTGEHLVPREDFLYGSEAGLWRTVRMVAGKAPVAGGDQVAAGHAGPEALAPGGLLSNVSGEGSQDVAPLTVGPEQSVPAEETKAVSHTENVDAELAGQVLAAGDAAGSALARTEGEIRLDGSGQLATGEVRALAERLREESLRKLPRSVELRLDPPDLGKVTAVLTARGQDIAVRFVAQSHDAIRALERSADELARSFGELGLTLAGFTVAEGHSRQASSGESRDGAMVRTRRSTARSLRAETVTSQVPGAPDLTALTGRRLDYVV